MLLQKSFALLFVSNSNSFICIIPLYWILTMPTVSSALTSCASQLSSYVESLWGHQVVWQKSCSENNDTLFQDSQSIYVTKSSGNRNKSWSWGLLYLSVICACLSLIVLLSVFWGKGRVRLGFILSLFVISQKKYRKTV